MERVLDFHTPMVAYATPMVNPIRNPYSAIVSGMEASGIGERIRALRTRAGMSVGALAVKVGIGENAMRKIENGESKAPSFVTGVRIADALAADAWFLAFGKERGHGARDEARVQQPSVNVVPPAGMSASVEGDQVTLSLLPGYVMLGSTSEEIGQVVLPAVRQALEKTGARLVPELELRSLLKQVHRLQDEVARLRAAQAATAKARLDTQEEAQASQATESPPAKGRSRARRRKGGTE